jgi:hypothetical protein
MVSPEYFFHSQTFSRNFSRPKSWRDWPWASSCAFDDDLGGDAGVVGARLPQRVVAAHAVVARQRIHDRLVEAVAHVQGAGDVRRRQQDAEIVGPGGVESGGEIAARLPDRVPAPLDVGRFEALGEFHRSAGKCKSGNFSGRPSPDRPKWALNLRRTGVWAIIAAFQSWLSMARSQFP